MNVLLVGSGGREHAIAWKINQSPLLDNLFIAPGNAGTTQLGINVNISVNDFEKLAELCTNENIDLVIVGPEEPLVKGLTDYFRASEKLASVPIVGPVSKGAQLEGSKEFAKEFMVRHAIPTAGYFTATSNNMDEAFAHLDKSKAPFVLKADGLAAGKGVLIIDDVNEAKDELKQMLDGKFGQASSRVVIEEHLKGIELSCFVLTDGINYVTLPEAKDYKRIGEGDTGLNTGGMGCVSPVPFADESFLKKVDERVIQPTVKGLKKDGIDYQGFIFFGLMNVNGDPYVIEYNVRLGDPETEVILPRLKDDFLQLLYAAARKELKPGALQFDPKACTTIVLVSGGYPEAYKNGFEITKIDEVEDSIVFHAGTSLSGNKVVTSGGRVLAVSSLAKDFRQALEISNRNAAIIEFEGKNYRTDIGFDL